MPKKDSDAQSTSTISLPETPKSKMPKFIRKLNNKSETLSKASSRISSQLLTSMLREDKKKSMLLHFCSSLETIKSWTISNCSETHSSIKEKLKLFYFSITMKTTLISHFIPQDLRNKMQPNLKKNLKMNYFKLTEKSTKISSKSISTQLNSTTLMSEEFI